MELGDKIKQVTDAVGIKQCSGCTERQSFLNQVGRRGFIGALAFAVVSFKNWQAITNRTDATPNQAMLFARSLVTNALVLREELGRYPSKVELLGLQERAAKLPGSPAWTTLLDFDSDEVLNGWKFDFAHKADGYLFILNDKLGNVLVTSHAGLIYHATNGGLIPKAEELDNPEAFPGAVPYSESRPAPSPKFSFWQIMEIFFPAVARAQGGGCVELCEVICDGMTCLNQSCVSCSGGACTLARFLVGVGGCQWCMSTDGSCSHCLDCSQKCGLSITRCACGGCL